MATRKSRQQVSSRGKRLPCRSYAWNNFLVCRVNIRGSCRLVDLALPRTALRWIRSWTPRNFNAPRYFIVASRCYNASSSPGRPFFPSTQSWDVSDFSCWNLLLLLRLRGDRRIGGILVKSRYWLLRVFNEKNRLRRVWNGKIACDVSYIRDSFFCSGISSSSFRSCCIEKCYHNGNWYVILVGALRRIQEKKETRIEETQRKGNFKENSQSIKC